MDKVEIGFPQETNLNRYLGCPCQVAQEEAVLKGPSDKLGHCPAPYLLKSNLPRPLRGNHSLVFLVFLKIQPGQQVKDGFKP